MILISRYEAKNMGAVIALTGRGIGAGAMFGFIEEMGLSKSALFVLEPPNRQWYPLPNGENDQADAIRGIEVMIPTLRTQVKKILTAWELSQDDVAIIGYSAGGVMALKLLEYATKPFAAVVSVAGAILMPKNYGIARTSTPVLLRHNVDDDVFDWKERYLPMVEALDRGGYNLTVEERYYGGHGVNLEDAHLVGNFVATHLGYFGK